MKKVKIMLTSLAVLAVVGGALAFKAKNFGGGTVYCATPANQGANASDATCPAVSPSTFSAANPAVSYCTITVNTPCSTAATAPSHLN